MDRVDDADVFLACDLAPIRTAGTSHTEGVEQKSSKTLPSLPIRKRFGYSAPLWGLFQIESGSQVKLAFFKAPSWAIQVSDEAGSVLPSLRRRR